MKTNKEGLVNDIEAMRGQPYRFFEPTGKASEFLDAIGSGENFVTLFSAANGIGKSATSLNALAHLMFPCGNKYFQMPLWKKWIYPKRGRIVSDPTNIVDNIIPALKLWLPNGRYTTSKKGKNYEVEWVMDNGWIFTIMTYDQDPKEFEGPTLGWIMMDEPPPQAIYKANISRLRKGGICWISATPLKGSAWMYDAIVKKSGPGTGRAYIEADVESACVDHGVRGHLRHEDIVRMVNEYDDADKQARIYGKFQHLIGMVFKSYSNKVHVIEPFLIDPSIWTVYHALDTHPRNPDAGLWVAVNDKGICVVIDEIYENGMVDQLAHKIKIKNDRYNTIRLLGEPAMFIEDQHNERNLASKFAEHGVSYEPAPKDRTYANRLIANAFDYKKFGDEFIKAPMLYIFSDCTRMIFEIEHYTWDEWTGKTKDNRMAKEVPVDKDDHLIEDLGRILTISPRHIHRKIGNESVVGSNVSTDPY